MDLVFLLEEDSMKRFLKGILDKIIPVEQFNIKLLVHEGKSHLKNATECGGDSLDIVNKYNTRQNILTFLCYHYAIMVQSFRNKGTEDIFNGKRTKAARKTCPPPLWPIAARKLEQLDSVISTDELLIPPGNKLEMLKGNRMGQHSIRINDQYRICFRWIAEGPEHVEITDYH
ncbi:type II toxin-antitoxin system RelE/ParE family toxin [Desulfobacterales bacterium HSG2]|nr:type II toxin-antitoxin system RelE/ParE family toxin [Desulfobacterales bacterium HSG2]